MDISIILVYSIEKSHFDGINNIVSGDLICKQDMMYFARHPNYRGLIISSA
jgi:hypothetical protein